MDKKTLEALDPVTEFPSLIWPMTDELRMEAAMVLWEAFLEHSNTEDPWDGPCARWRDVVGAVEARHALMALVEPLHIGWHVHERATPDGDGTMCPFDWEFAPWFLKECVEFDVGLSGAAYMNLKTDWLAQCRAVRAVW